MTRRLELGASWHDYPILIGPGNTSSPTLGRYWYGAAALQAKYDNAAELFGHRNRLTVAAYAVHVFSTGMPAGFVGTRGGTFMASCDSFDVRVVGRGGHGFRCCGIGHGLFLFRG